MSQKEIRNWSLTSALAGFLFGFDTVVISGANLPIKELWHTEPFFHGFFIMSMALWGTVLGAIFAGYPCDLLGRKKTLLWIGILFLISAVGCGIAWDPYSFSFFRFIGGVGIGASSVAAPTYISEISPSDKRGSLVAQYQFMIVFGILIAFFSNYLLKGVGGDMDWRLMMAVPAIPSLIYCIVVANISDSPRWLYLNKGDETEARVVLSKMGEVDILGQLHWPFYWLFSINFQASTSYCIMHLKYWNELDSGQKTLCLALYL
jgi:MFS family permease